MYNRIIQYSSIDVQSPLVCAIFAIKVCLNIRLNDHTKEVINGTSTLLELVTDKATKWYGQKSASGELVMNRVAIWGIVWLLISILKVLYI